MNAALLALFLVDAGPARVAVNGPDALSAAVARVMPSVVSISVNKLTRQTQKGSEVVQVRANGSGFVLDELGHVLTCNHVIADYEAIAIRFSDGSECDCSQVVVVGRDPVTDIALLRVTADRKFVAARLADSDSLDVGQWVAAVGSPYGLDGSATAGIVSGLDRWGLHKSSGPDFQEFIQTDALINPGNSGGPLIDMQGRVVGVLSFAKTLTRNEPTGIGFATPVNLARRVAEQLKAHGAVIRGWLGVSTQPITEGIRQALGLTDDGGALVTSVTARSPAEIAGIKPGDVVQTLDGAPVPDVRWMQNELAGRRPGDTVRIGIAHQGRTVQLSVALAAWPVASTVAREAPPARYRFGLLVLEIDDAARMRTGATYGVLVREVEPASAANDAGLMPGDVIVEADFLVIGNMKAFGAALSRVTDRPMLVRVLRGRNAFYAALGP